MIDLQPSLANELVQLRPLLPEDLEPLFAAANDPKIWEQHPNKRNQRDEFEKFFGEAIASMGALAIIDIQNKKIIGSSRYNPTKGFQNGIEIGWTFLARDYWGGTYNKAIKETMIAHAFNYVEHVFLYIAKDNIRSQMAAKKIGARLIQAKEIEGLLDKGPNHLIYMIKKEKP